MQSCCVHSGQNYLKQVEVAKENLLTELTICYMVAQICE